MKKVWLRALRFVRVILWFCASWLPPLWNFDLSLQKGLVGRAVQWKLGQRHGQPAQNRVHGQGVQCEGLLEMVRTDILFKHWNDIWIWFVSFLSFPCLEDCLARLLAGYSRQIISTAVSLVEEMQSSNVQWSVTWLSLPGTSALLLCAMLGGES